MDTEDHGERIAALEVENTNLKERVGKIEKGAWAVVLSFGGYIMTQIMQMVQGGQGH